MPRPDIQTSRRRALVQAAIAEIGKRGTLDVTVGGIARRAGVSSALAHHYFGSKDHILTAAMRHILQGLRAEHMRRLRGVTGPRERLRATIAANFGGQSFRREVIAAWLAFYVSAQHDREARRLLRVYQRRLRSALLSDLRPLAGDDAPQLADTVAALIDGFYIREASRTGAADPAGLAARIDATLDILLEARA
ncbi:transcriptional regulator, TetR family [Palleronia salina]|uniref:HTH-type transcriptional regulator BetI n=1 Tax=Palleronia salina TaxID=313368 RepID=A0A1M6G6F1_9RHOB|nr:transcriptional regulator BetI [Palleronia salina]SHJ05490.1 transcriptional regulator, TetR family [Palleronia salina]